MTLSSGENKVYLYRSQSGPSIRNLGALIRTCGPCCRNVNIRLFFNFYVLTTEVSRGLSVTAGTAAGCGGPHRLGTRSSSVCAS